jgi:hypothetical protein
MIGGGTARETTMGEGREWRRRGAAIVLLLVGCSSAGGGPGADGDDGGTADVPSDVPADATDEGDAGSEADGDEADDGRVEATLVWPNAESAANSDPWLAEHHAEIAELRPRVMVLNFVNAKTNEQVLAQLAEVVDGMAESSRWHGYDDPWAPSALRYELAYAIDLRDETPPAGWPYNNSTLYPREDPPTGTWGFDYEQLFAEEFAVLYDIPDPDDPAHKLDLCELIDRGLVHEVWIVADGDVPDAGAAEILENKPVYDENRVRRADGRMNRCAGNGCFDDDDVIPADCTRTVRIAFFNHTRGPGCFLESLAHGFESIGAWNPRTVPYLSRHFIPWANYGLDVRYGVSWDSWYQCPIGADCLSYPTETSVAYDISGLTGTFDPYDPVCGNVHFPPNARRHYDLDSPFTVRSTCTTWREGGGSGGADVPQPFARAAFRFYERLAPDCMGAFLIWWRQNVPGPNNGLLADDGTPVLSWWPFVYY